MDFFTVWGTMESMVVEVPIPSFLHKSRISV